MQKTVVLITGGSSGIGKSIGLYLQSKGLTVYGTTRDPNRHPDFESFPLIRLEVTDIDSVHSAIQHLLKKEGQIDVLVNNAGVGITGPIEETPHDEIQKAFDINFYGPLHMIKAVLPQMRRQRSGCIINITSIAGSMGLPYRGIYSATKASMEIVTEALRMETKDFDIRISALAPGDFATNIAAGRYHVPVRTESPYNRSYAKTLKMINEAVDTADDPILVAKQVYSIIHTARPKVHYRVGDFMQKFSILLKKTLPDRLYEKLLTYHYKL